MADNRGSYWTSFKIGPTSAIAWKRVIIGFGPALLAVPGLSIWSIKGDISLRGLPELISGLAIITGFLFALLLFAFQLKREVVRDSATSTRSQVPARVDELFGVLGVATLASLTLTSVLMLMAACGYVSPDQGAGGTERAIAEPIAVTVGTLAAFTFSHLVLAGLRLKAAYRAPSS